MYMSGFVNFAFEICGQFRGHGEFLCNLDVIIFSFPYLNRKLWKRINTTDVINLGKRERENPK